MMISTKHSAIADARKVQEQYVQTFSLMLQQYMLTHTKLPRRISIDVDIRDTPPSIAFSCELSSDTTKDSL